MAGKIGGVLAMAVVIGGLLFLAAPGEAAEAECGPITLDMLFPGLDVNGDPIPTTTTAPPIETTSTTIPDATSSTQHATTTTTAPTTTTTIATTTPTAPTLPEPCRSWVYEMEWPLAVESRVFSGFGADRDGGARRHKGNDIVAGKLSPVVAVADGVVTSIHSTPPDDCCWLMITHDDGWQSLYVHLNNDTYLTDDGLGHGVRPGLEAGSQVEAGQVIGWIGDSGNAEGTVPHLHFELRHPSGYSVDPNSSLAAARAKAELSTASGPYLDLEGMGLGFQVSTLLTSGVFWPCDEIGVDFCPNRLAQPDDTSDLLNQMTGLTSPLVQAREQLIRLHVAVPRNRLADVIGCYPVETCLESGITAGDVARLSYWANIAMRAEADVEDLDSAELLRTTTAREAEQGLRILGRIGICHEPVDDQRLIGRSEVLRLLTWWVLGLGQTPCSEADPTR